MRYSSCGASPGGRTHAQPPFLAVSFPTPQPAARRHTRLRTRRCAGAPPDGWHHVARSDPLHFILPPTPVLPPILPPAAPVRSKYPADEVAEPRNAQEIRSRLVASGSAIRVACTQTRRASSKTPVAHPCTPGACPCTCSAFLQTVEKELAMPGWAMLSSSASASRVTRP